MPCLPFTGTWLASSPAVPKDEQSIPSLPHAAQPKESAICSLPASPHFCVDMCLCSFLVLFDLLGLDPLSSAVLPRISCLAGSFEVTQVSSRWLQNTNLFSPVQPTFHVSLPTALAKQAVSPKSVGSTLQTCGSYQRVCVFVCVCIHACV